ncbi:MAG: hypothetical protein ABEK50_02255 [bacterium]
MGLLVLLPVTPSLAYTSEDFVTELKTKFRTTSSIFLKARSTGLDLSAESSRMDFGDTATIVLAYSYPNQYLQVVDGQSNKRQYLMIKNDSMAISYPHLDYSEKRTISKRQRRSLLVRNVPIAGAIMGLTSGEVPHDSIDVTTGDTELTVVVHKYREDLPFKRVEARFRRDNLQPVYFILEGKRKFRIDIVHYEEEKRFPEWIEDALLKFDFKQLEDGPL